MQNIFNVGDKVTAISFTDCFGEFVAETRGLVVSEVREVARMGQEPYYRLVARPADGRGYVEGAERFFALEAAHA